MMNLKRIVSCFLVIFCKTGIPTLLKRAQKLSATIATLSIDTINTDEVSERTGRIDLNNRNQLQVMLDQFNELLKTRSDWDKTP